MVKTVPVSSKVPPLDAEYQYMIPVLEAACNTTEPEPQVPAGVVEVMKGNGKMVAVTGVRATLTQPLAVTATKYVVVTLNDGVVNDNPVKIELPPVAEVYQSMVPAPVLADKTILPGPHRLLDITPVMVGMVFTVAVTGVLVPDAQPL